MPTMETAELSVRDRGMLATSASATYLDSFSAVDRLLFNSAQPALVGRQRKYYSLGREYQVQWKDYGQALPSWFDPLMQGFVDLLTLPTNWDSYGAGPIDQHVVHNAMNLINGLLAATSPAPRVVPLSDGGVQLEWHRPGVDLEITLDRGGQQFFYYRNRVDGGEVEHTLPQESALLRSIVGHLD